MVLTTAASPGVKAEDISKLKKQLQDHLGDGLLVVIGSGLSIAEGVPGMQALGVHLCNCVGKEILAGIDIDVWEQIREKLDLGMGLESALNAHSPPPELAEVIVRHTAAFIRSAETKVIRSVVIEGKVLRLTRLMEHLVVPATGLAVITTNYDRLAELAIEAAGYPCESMFMGHYSGAFDPDKAKYYCAKEIHKAGRRAELRYIKRVKIYKPHGSLDWYSTGGNVLRCAIDIDELPLIITPGLAKYETGYEIPFSDQREKANQAIDKASRYLIIGYGFNDKHLETCLSRQMRQGKPTVILTHTLTDNARKIIADSPKATALTKTHRDGVNGTGWVTQESDRFIANSDMHDIFSFIGEVLKS